MAKIDLSEKLDPKSKNPYIIMSSADKMALLIGVNDKIREGYIPLGGLVAYNTPGELFHQAMIYKGK